MRIQLFFQCLFASLILPSCVAESKLSPESLSTDQIDLLEKFSCEQSVRAYAHSRDQVDWRKNIALFTQDAVMQFGDLKLSGHQEIKKALLDRGPKRFTRHIITSVNITKTDGGNLEGTSYAVVYGANSNIDGPKPLTANSVDAILTYRDVFNVRDGHCFITKRAVTLDMVRTNEE